MGKAIIVFMVLSGCSTMPTQTTVCDVNTRIVFTDKRSVNSICGGYEACVRDGDIIAPVLKGWGDRAGLLKLGHEVAHFCMEAHE